MLATIVAVAYPIFLAGVGGFAAPPPPPPPPPPLSDSTMDSSSHAEASARRCALLDTLPATLAS